MMNTSLFVNKLKELRSIWTKPAWQRRRED